jgi:drug/metabolite transporter (DMT)-like permease
VSKRVKQEHRAVLANTQVQAALWMLAAVGAFVGMMVAVRDLSGTLSVGQILTMRCLLGLPMLLVLIWAMMGRAGFRKLRTGSMRLQLFRNATHLMGQAAWVYGISVLPLATILAVEYSTPLWAVLMGIPFLAEHPNRAQKIALTLGFAAVLLIVRPGSDSFSFDLLIVVGGSFAYAAAHMTTRVLGRTDDSLAVVFWMNVLQLPVTLAFALTDWRPIPDEAWPTIVILAAGGVAAHQFMSKSLAMAPLSVVMPIDFLRLPLVAVIGAIFYGEAVDPIEMTGALILIGAVLLAQRK